jgi:hypothetical protein
MLMLDCIALWFISCLVRLRKHPVARYRFIQVESNVNDYNMKC